MDVQVMYDDDDDTGQQIMLTANDGRMLLFDWCYGMEKGGVTCSYYPANTPATIDMPYMQDGNGEGDNYRYHSSTAAEVVRAYNEALNWTEAELTDML